MTRDDMLKNFSRVNVGEKEQEDIDAVNKKVKELAEWVFDFCPEGRLKSIAMTKLEECSMFITKSISHK